MAHTIAFHHKRVGRRVQRTDGVLSRKRREVHNIFEYNHKRK